MKQDYHETLKILILVFLSNPVSFNGQDYEKQKRPGTSEQLFFRLQNMLQKFFFIGGVCNDVM